MTIWRSRAQTIGVAGTILLHVAVFGVTLGSAHLGARYRRSTDAIQSTFYVGLGQALAAPVQPVATEPSQPSPSGSEASSRGSGALGTPAQTNNSQRHTHDTRDEQFSAFLPPRELDISALLVSEPDYTLLNGLANSHLPIRLRLFIDARGKLVDIDVLHADERDSDAVTHVRAMFFIATFLPGRRNQTDVPSYLDIELNIDDSMRLAPVRPN